MANNSTLSIEHLPMEILHRIFDHLDAQTVLFSVRPVCRSFRSIVNSYDRYQFDFQIISKHIFDRLCRLIPPQHLISLKLYNDERIPDQISMFISNYHLRQVTRLRSINFSGISECQLNYILKRINLHRLTTFSLHIEKYNDRQQQTTEHNLSLVMAQPTLRKVEINIISDRIYSIKWPLNCRMESLIINDETFIDDLIPIFVCSPRLHRLVLKNMAFDINDSTIPKSSFLQLTSLTVEELDASIEELESFLFLTPSLTHLKLMGEGCFQDGKRWEDFIQVNLPHLDRFEFRISLWRLFDQTREYLQSIIEPFRSPFWIERKKWFVAGEFHINVPRVFHIYSIPICTSILQNELDPKRCFLSTSDHLSIPKNIDGRISP